MNKVTIIVLLLFAPAVAQCSPVRASQDGDKSAQLFYCEVPGCATDVIDVFCDDKLIFSGTSISHCTGPPSNNTVCQHDGLAFVSSNTTARCEFEGTGGYISTKKCTVQSSICSSLIATTQSPITQKDQAIPGYIAAGFCVLVLLAGLFLCFAKTLRSTEQQPASDSGVTVPLKDVQIPGETTEGAVNIK